MEARSRTEAKEAKAAEREERLQRARGRLGAEHARREKAEAETNAVVKAMREVERPSSAGRRWL